LKTVDTRRLLLSFVALALLFWVVSRRSFFADTISSPFLSIALLSVTLILLRTRVSSREIIASLALFLAFCAYDLEALGYPARWPVWASFLGIAGLGVLCLRFIWSDGAEHRLAAWTLGPAFFFVASEWMASYFLEWTGRARPTVLDLYLYSFDASLHAQFPFALGRVFVRFPAFAYISLLVYLGLPVAIGLTYAGCLMRDREKAISAFAAFILTGPLGVVFYNIFPALGPVHLFRGDFPWHPLTYKQASHLFLEPVALAGPRNAMPSLHAAWIFLVFWYARYLSRLEKTVAGIFVFFTLCATLGTGEHYFVDLIVAVPFTLLVLALAEFLSGHLRTALVWPGVTGLGMTLAWFLVLRSYPEIFWGSPLVPWGACLASLTFSLLAGRGLLDSLLNCESCANPATSNASAESGESERPILPVVPGGD
jgi:PAP2 superfamily